MSEVQLREEITRIGSALELMRRANAAIDRGEDDVLAQLGFSVEHIEDLKRPNSEGARGFPEYALKNNETTLRALELDLATCTRRALSRVGETSVAYAAPHNR